MTNRSTGVDQSLAPHTNCDVAIVGYGPVGMIAAGCWPSAALTWSSQNAGPSGSRCPGRVISTAKPCEPSKKQGIAEDIERVARPVLEQSLVSADTEVLATVMLGDGGSGRKESYLSYQPEIEAIFDAKVRELGAHVHMGMVATGLEHGPDAAIRTVVGSDGPEAAPRPDAEPHTIRAAYVIGADGARSWVRAPLGGKRMDMEFPALDELVIDFEPNDPDVVGVSDVPAVLDELADVLVRHGWHPDAAVIDDPDTSAVGTLAGHGR